MSNIPAERVLVRVTMRHYVEFYKSANNHIHTADSGRVKSYIGRFQNKKVRVIQHEVDREGLGREASTTKNFLIFCNNLCCNSLFVNLVGLGDCNDNNEYTYFVLEDGFTLAEFLAQPQIVDPNNPSLQLGLARTIMLRVIEAVKTVDKHGFAIEVLKLEDVIIVDRGPNSLLAEQGVKISGLEAYKFFGNHTTLPVQPPEYKGGSRYTKSNSRQTAKALGNFFANIPLSTSAEARILHMHLIDALQKCKWTVDEAQYHLYFWDAQKIIMFISTISDWLKTSDEQIVIKFDMEARIIFNTTWTSHLPDEQTRYAFLNRILPRYHPSPARVALRNQETYWKSRQASFLLRAIRNLWAHRTEINRLENPKLSILLDTNNFQSFCGQTFPTLLSTVFDFVCANASTEEDRRMLESFTC